MDRKAKIIATIGPASSNEKMLEALIMAGMNVARLNFSHGTQAGHAAVIENIRRISQQLGRSIGILQDLQGPKIRVGSLPAPLELDKGEHVCLFREGNSKPGGYDKCIPVDFHELADYVIVGSKILLDDGRLALVVDSVSDRDVIAHVISGGTLHSNKGINLPGVRLDLAGITLKDKEDLAFGLKHKVDAVAVSFVRSALDIEIVREFIDELGPGQRKPMLIAKLERAEALENLEQILSAADGVMVARGDLGVEMPPENVPVMQKHIIQEANARGKLVITATQMLESMINSRLPTRAEASDVANAIFDGTDAVMLSGETAVGKYPVESVSMMDRIIRSGEEHFLDWGLAQQDSRMGDGDSASMARAAHEIAHDRGVAAIAVFSMQGTSAWVISKVRPRVQILAFTPDESTYRRMAFLWGVKPRLVAFADSLEAMIGYVDTALLKTGDLHPGQQVVVVCGFPVGAMRPPNMALLHTLGD